MTVLAANYGHICELVDPNNCEVTFPVRNLFHVKDETRARILIDRGGELVVIEPSLELCGILESDWPKVRGLHP
jgi:hypothetical protein